MIIIIIIVAPRDAVEILLVFGDVLKNGNHHGRHFCFLIIESINKKQYHRLGILPQNRYFYYYFLFNSWFLFLILAGYDLQIKQVLHYFITGELIKLCVYFPGKLFYPHL